MSDEPSASILSVFNEAVEIEDAARRGEFLGTACGDDAALREKVEGLLKAHAEMGGGSGFLGGAGDGLADPASAGEAGEKVGRYKLLQKIGEGGWGIVYMAEQMVPVRRRVALKIIKPGMDSRQVMARF